MVSYEPDCVVGTSSAGLWEGDTQEGIPPYPVAVTVTASGFTLKKIGAYMSAKKATFRVIPVHSVTYTDSDGEEQTKEFRTSGPNGAMKIHPGGSVFLGMLTLLVAISTPSGEVLQVLSGICARIRRDGEVVLEPTLRKEEWFDGNGNAHPGAYVFDFVGDETRIALGAVACKAIPALAKRVKSARAALVKRAA